MPIADIKVGDEVEIRHIHAWENREGRVVEVRADVALVEIRALEREDDRRTMRVWLPRLALRVREKSNT